MLYPNRVRDLSVELDRYVKRRKGKERASPEAFMMTEADIAAYIGCKIETARKFLNGTPRICLDRQRIYMIPDVAKRLYQLEIDAAENDTKSHILQLVNEDPKRERIREIRENLECRIAALKSHKNNEENQTGPAMLTVSDLVAIMKRSNQTISNMVNGLPRIQSGKNIYYHIRDVAKRLAQLEMEAAS